MIRVGDVLLGAKAYSVTPATASRSAKDISLAPIVSVSLAVSSHSAALFTGDAWNDPDI